MPFRNNVSSSIGIGKGNAGSAERNTLRACILVFTRKQFLAYVSGSDLLQGKIFALAVRDQFFKFVSLEGIKILYFKIPVCENVFDHKFMLLAKIDESVFFTGPQYIE
jgi:hypothetical protein